MDNHLWQNVINSIAQSFHLKCIPEGGFAPRVIVYSSGSKTLWFCYIYIQWTKGELWWFFFFFLPHDLKWILTICLSWWDFTQWQQKTYCERVQRMLLDKCANVSHFLRKLFFEVTIFQQYYILRGHQNITRFFLIYFPL